MTIAVDFDGTIVENKYPEIGTPNICLIERLKHLQEQGVELILWTCRNGELLEQAINYLKDNFNFTFNYINSNSIEKLKLYHYNDTRKVGADYYIDDKCLSVDEFMRRFYEEKSCD